MSFFGKITGALKSLLGKFIPLFRQGLDQFLKEALPRVIEIALEMLGTQSYGSAHEFANALWKRLRMEFFQQRGTWLSIVGALALEAVKQLVLKDPKSVRGLSLNGWLSQ